MKRLNKNLIRSETTVVYKDYVFDPYYTRPTGYPQIGVYHKKGSGKKMPRYILKCGCCNEKLEIYYDDEGLEISGVTFQRNSDKE